MEQNLKTDQDQDYFVGGSIYDETFFDTFYPVRGFTYPFSFQAYSPRQTGNVEHALPCTKNINSDIS